MSQSWNTVVVAFSLCAGGAIAHAGPIYLPTNVGNGADAEVRESNPTQNRGASTEIATRVIDRYKLGHPDDGNDRNSVIYLQFDLSTLGSIDAVGSMLRLTLRNNNLTDSRISDTDGVSPDHGSNGLQYYGIPGASFNELTLTYLNAPGLTFDGDVGTKDFNGDAMFLGDKDLPAIGSQSHLPVGSAVDFSSAALDAFLADEWANNPNGVAVIAVTHRNLGLTSDPGGLYDKAGSEPADWSNFNYLFNPKEQTTLNDDLNYDSDINDPGNLLGNPLGGADNSTGAFSPQLIFVPAPPTAVLMAGAALLARRKR